VGDVLRSALVSSAFGVAVTVDGTGGRWFARIRD
jgi:hypothetical protein